MQPKMCSRIAFSYLLIFVSVNFVRSGLIASLKSPAETTTLQQSYGV